MQYGQMELDLVQTFDAVADFIKEYGEDSFWRVPASVIVPLILAEVEERHTIDLDNFYYVIETIYQQKHLRNPAHH
jgi:hypothetical protein